MQAPDPRSQATHESLAGQWHSIGALELRRLVLEGAILVVQESDTTIKILCSPIIVMTSDARVAALKSAIPDAEALLVCLDTGWGPAPGLATYLHDLGFHHVFTAETSYGGMIAINAAGGHDLL